MDMQMPVMDGLTATREIRALETAKGLSRTPILMLTARSQEGDRIRARNSGADDYLVKPFAATNLLASLQALEQQI